MTNEPVLLVHGLAVGYGTNTVAKNVNLSLSAGRLTGLIGMNGVGKSTLIRTLSGLQRPLGGSVLLNNRDLFGYSQSELAQNLALVLTEKMPPGSLSVGELVALGRQPYTGWWGKLSAHDRAAVTEAMTVTGITPLSNKKHFEISDGQLQKALIARAIAQNTPLIILDEPTTHLDLGHKMTVLKLLKNLAAGSGKAVLFSSHDPELALQLCDDILLMAPDFVLQDSPERLIANGHLDKLFGTPDVVFDREKRQFIFKTL